MEELEAQRPGNDKQTQIVRSYIESGEYRRKFNRITDRIELSRLLYQLAKQMLYHRSGTRYEDMYWIDLDSAKVVAQELDTGSEECIVYSKATWNAIETHSRLLTMHTHPNSMPPSIDDFNSCVANNYAAGLVICHDGRIYLYSASEVVMQEYFSLTVAGYKNMGYDEEGAQIAAIKEIGQNFKIQFKEVTDNDDCARK